MTDIEITRLCAEAMGLTKGPEGYGLIGHMANHPYDPLHDDAQAMGLVKRLSIQIHHHGCADAKASLVTVKGHWVPYSKEFKVCADDLNRAICECVAKMKANKP